MRGYEESTRGEGQKLFRNVVLMKNENCDTICPYFANNRRQMTYRGPMHIDLLFLTVLDTVFNRSSFYGVQSPCNPNVQCDP